jgi:diguanylate cyclase (GGDEF)-like protein
MTAGQHSPLHPPLRTAAGERFAARPVDSLEAEFRLRSARAAAWVTLMVCVPGIVYALLGGGRANRIVFVVVFVVAFLGGLAAFVAPWEAVIRSRWREAVFLAWTMSTLAMITLAVVADGGPESPVTSLLFIPIVYVGTSYPTWSVNVASLVATADYASLAVDYHQAVGRSVIVLGALGGAALMSWWQARGHARRRDHLARISRTDPLTGVLNRRGLADAAASSFATLHRFGMPFALIILDLDGFKTYNDAHGHIAGDRLLAWTANQIQGALRANDVLARIGGDEFVILAAGADVAAARSLVQRIELACADRAPHSIGIATAPADGADYDSLYRVADGALYEDKLLPDDAEAVAQAWQPAGRSDPL